MTNSRESKATGVRLEKYVIDELDTIVEESRYLGVTRSELINAVLVAYLKSDSDRSKKVDKLREIVIKIRKGLM